MERDEGGGEGRGGGDEGKIGFQDWFWLRRVFFFMGRSVSG